MGKIVVGFLAVAWAFAGARNFPRLNETSNAAACVVVASCVVGAYWLGCRSKRASAMAVAAAVAIAESRAASAATATASVHVVLDPSLGAMYSGAGPGSLPWIGAREVDMIESDAVDSMVLDIAESRHSAVEA